ncbi:MAG: glycosyltransferase [Acidobacteriota bacterium]|nr:MAG: glycosyltransferase [Acidobacteriota bacterium]
MDLLSKLAFVVTIIAASIILSRWLPLHPRWRPLVIALNIIVSVRYLWWRATETLNWEGGIGTVLSLTIFIAEIYGFLVVLHHYLIATRHTDRRADEPDAEFTPSVDVFIATYNESLDTLYRTIVGCLALDYPDKRVHVLDDGNRPELGTLCRELGAGYIARADNAGAKAGNLNNALQQTDADLVVTFDADHVPVRTFLNETVGFFRDDEIVQVQTPHHFYNPDLFQDRLRIREFIANEQDMFYHVVQPGRDVYNSSFYCGSGAVFRREALDSIGGFPMQTVTEDLHTSILLHSRGWKSVFVNRDLSAGLAPESYDAYLTQRRRWARGTFQVMLTRGELFRRGLSLMQRINYLSTLWYWLYGFPRVVYVVAPLFFLLGGIEPLVIDDLTDLLVYYIPHLAISIVAFQLVNMGMRRIFWSDVYESCISVQIALTALLFPFTATKKTRFAVTPKGKAALTKSSWHVTAPIFVLFVGLLIGMTVGVIRLASGFIDPGGTLINTFWAAYNLIVISMGLLLLRSVPSRRAAVRLPRRLRCLLSWNGAVAEAETIDLSENGLSLRLSKAQPLPEMLDLMLTGLDGTKLALQGRLVRCDVDAEHELSVALEFVNQSQEQRRHLVELMFSDPLSWSGPHSLTIGAPEHLMRLVRAMISIFSAERALRRLAPRLRGEVLARIETSGRFIGTARTVDLSLNGAALRLNQGEIRPREDLLRITFTWNPIERSTIEAEVRSVRMGASGETILGVGFVNVTMEQREDLAKHLYRESPADALPEGATP